MNRAEYHVNTNIPTFPGDNGYYKVKKKLIAITKTNRQLGLMNHFFVVESI